MLFFSSTEQSSPACSQHGDALPQHGAMWRWTDSSETVSPNEPVFLYGVLHGLCEQCRAYVPLTVGCSPDCGLHSGLLTAASSSLCNLRAKLPLHLCDLRVDDGVTEQKQSTWSFLPFPTQKVQVPLTSAPLLLPPN